MNGLIGKATRTTPKEIPLPNQSAQFTRPMTGRELLQLRMNQVTDEV